MMIDIITKHYIQIRDKQICLTDTMTELSNGNHLLYLRYERLTTYNSWEDNYFLSKNINDFHSQLIYALIINKNGNNFKIIKKRPYYYDYCHECISKNECFIRNLDNKCSKIESILCDNCDRKSFCEENGTTCEDFKNDI